MGGGGRQERGQIWLRDGWVRGTVGGMNTNAEPDLAVITRQLRAMYGSRLLIAAVSHLQAFEAVAEAPRTAEELRTTLGLPERSAMVLFPALRAMGLLAADTGGRLRLTEAGSHLLTSVTPNLAGYVGLEQDDAGVVEMASRLRHDGPVSATGGTAYVKESHEASPMDDPVLARHLTLALAGRARLLAPLAAPQLPKSEGHLLDVAGGTGLFACEWLRRNPRATATVYDRPEVLRVAAEFRDEFCRSGRPDAATVRERLQFQPGNMLEDELPRADLILAASLFHDWPVGTCRSLMKRLAEVLQPGGEIWAHDAFLNDALDGPLAVTDYSAQLFWVTKGRCYSRAEYRGWFTDAGLQPLPGEFPTALDYSLISARKAR